MAKSRPFSRSDRYREMENELDSLRAIIAEVEQQRDALQAQADLDDKRISKWIDRAKALEQSHMLLEQERDDLLNRLGGVKAAQQATGPGPDATENLMEWAAAFRDPSLPPLPPRCGCSDPDPLGTCYAAGCADTRVRYEYFCQTHLTPGWGPDGIAAAPPTASTRLAGED